MEPQNSPQDFDAEAFRPLPLPVEKERYGLHLLLFLLTFASATWAGAEQSTQEFVLFGNITNWSHWIAEGLWYSIPFLAFLTTHEFGHYFAARYHGINTSLPFYIPAPLMLLGQPFSIGTFGAVIRIRQLIPRTRQLFDIGIAGPLAGFVVAMGVLIYALVTLPPPSYLLKFQDGAHKPITDFIQAHGRFPQAGELDISGALMLGQTLLFYIVSELSPNMPPMYEIYHYPVLLAAWLGLFFTALNLMPVGQLDGGHIWYALVGAKGHLAIARFFTCLLLLSGSLGMMVEMRPALVQWLSESLPLEDLNVLYNGLSWVLMTGIQYLLLKRVFNGDHRWIAPVLLGTIVLTALPIGFTASHTPWLRDLGYQFASFGYTGWLLWAVLIVRFIRLEHPPVEQPEPLTRGRKVLAILSILIFMLCFSPTPIYFHY